jgi:hypothetical protein
LFPESVEDGYRLEETVALAGLAGSGERSLAAQIRQGQRILVSMKRSEFDLEPQKYTGIVKYVGKIDSEFIDNRVYVGVKLDEPGNFFNSHPHQLTPSLVHTLTSSSEIFSPHSWRH